MSRRLRNKNKKAVSLITNFNTRSPITEQYRLIRNNLHFSSVDKDIKTIVITSPDPSEGKSTTSANLSIILAQQGKKVLLVDTDLRKPTVHFAFKVSNIYGLTNILTKDINLEQAITKTYVANLDLLTSGPLPPNPSELLNSNAMELIIEDLKGLYDYVIFDTPPILVVTDSQVMASKCDGVVMVIASGKTKKDRAMKAKDFLEKANSLLLGVVVNGVDYKQKDYYGHYG
ncbi:CpsD/CapB family tyrosine-protein kinase [Neobacillus kokaensis]|uniref:non-specific protein-tyrosine kinase n=1 Tax=Neobacillus kokaensis TaxID=2759023 RepID=A0ABQ3N0W0_9BACI|nr:CpsD/CapB family tyrosine-protein kinase [Neobacillus kokaensis]GHH97714.1 protein-tyrosine kinase [Neobacillus kokaensis]